MANQDARESKVLKLWEKSDEAALVSFCEDYRRFLTACKTERACVSELTALLDARGAKSLQSLIDQNEAPKAGDLVYTDMMKKSLLVFRIGTDPITEGCQLLGAHIDSPRLDLKQRPLYEDQELSLFETHYYGGIKKYQWVTLPLALHGVIAKKDGSIVEVSIGEKEDEPVFCVTDLLPHLANKQMSKKMNEGVSGENLNVLVGSRPLKDTEKTAVKANILKILKEQCGVTEDDFVSAEIEVVPAGPARDCGFDRSMIMGYGQDDRVCAYPSLRAILDEETPARTSICLLTDKEEIGSVGATGMQSRFFENSLAELLALLGCYSDLNLRRTLARTHVLSSDVSAAFDPNYPDVMEKNNCAYLGRGPVFNKYTGARGKSGSNDANAEYIAYLRDLCERADIQFQTAELGKVDEGGGGTIAYILANLGMEVIDFGVAVLSMHAPFEVTSKADIYETYRAYRAFLASAK